MKIQSFEIENFKGIKRIKIDLSDNSPGNISTLVGLNESGKTTVLEALSVFGTADTETANLVGTVHEKAPLIDLIPKDKKAAFTGKIIIRAIVKLNKSDIDHVRDAYKKQDFQLKDDFSLDMLVIERNYVFKDSSYIETRTNWSVDFELRKSGAKAFKEYNGRPSEKKEDKQIWMIGINAFRERLPKTVYFPTFLFGFPDRIYLKDIGDDVNNYYRKIIQDVLDSQGNGLNIDNHIVARIDRVKEKHGKNPNFLSYLFASDEKKQIDAVLQKASAEMSRVIFGSWNEIFGRKTTGKRVQIDWLLDSEKENTPYVEVSIIDGESTYKLSERSLGFRWFFSFLLFTQFRVSRKNEAGTIFLFDEPASNLHSRAQIKLLDSFSKIARGTTYIVYSTHSHYMINPRWLERAYIIRNEAADYDADDALDYYEPRESDIKSIKYKTFVGSHPNLTTYFQPVLDALDVSFSPLISAKRALIVEGKFDYHPLMFFAKKMCTPNIKFDIFPATGSGAIVPLISLFRGWGVNFRILLDGDGAGKKEKSRYIEEHYIQENEARCLSDFDEVFDGKALEAAYQEDVIEAVKKRFDIDKIKKRIFQCSFRN
ncbi:TPA: AAA family ATPase [Burkholderia aenigmatica]|uniref:ATP-dependent nuclease n=1 Tax=Burkholderia sp. AU45251 TaxID=3059204 RepID=UPI0026553E3E|nr:AAA family ATPase [Burkholderia sp. AU45251]HDR9486110.1 AAA family ATPase [Burkholderia aenigmatica]MDN7517103.1 AAA family ATPase [Burkholderia sp. AU45251]HDR9517826.1 AAA family ATPase [Burkholderia aenigmatica]HDR9594530.1 AAA family ATPase [Burkholderia aenigmatica]HDR9600561.1 AAA family ATPase [Burkholderia aenigmatica]